jgi:7,8-dihydro-6-hydroxymethylpterin dimethyltransferase
MIEILRHTFSVCPVCMRRVPACLKARNSDIYLEKRCEEHGEFSTIVWRGEPILADWVGDVPEIAVDEGSACPDACGLCPEHRQDTCCILLEVTRRCNLACSHCFAESSFARPGDDPPLARVQAWITDIAGKGKTFLQLSGGEPTLRDDLPDIIRFAKRAGCEYVQLNSNGLRLAEDPDYVESLAKAGLSFVFLQFDGTTDTIYTRLRGQALLNTKLQAIEQCGLRNIGVTLVPTLVPGVNVQDIGAIIRLAVERSPLVRGVHFQPVSYFGRYPQAPDDALRVTLPEVLRAIFEQAGDSVPVNSIAPSHCDHARCGFHGAYIVTPEGLKALIRPGSAGCCRPVPAEKNRRFVGARWQRPASQGCAGNDKPGTSGGTTEPCDLSSLDGFFQRMRSHAFTLSAMAFQDAYTLDLERLCQCSLHVYADGAVRPFCAHYLTRANAQCHPET